MIKKVFKTILIIIMIVSLINIVIWCLENNKTKEIVNKTKKYINIGNQKPIDLKIKTINEDIVGWIIVDNTNINYPIVQANNNEYYLNHDLEKNYNSAGWIFMDSYNNMNDQNIILYGHHRRDGSMFGSIDNLFKYKEGKIQLIIGNESHIYNIFSIYITEKNYNYRERNYININKKIQEFKNRSIKEYNVEIKGKHQIITLSTCDNDNNNRIVVQGIKND